MDKEDQSIIQREGQVGRRVTKLQEQLRLLCNQHDSLAQLVRLLEAMPMVRKTEVSLRQLNSQINDCGKTYQLAQQAFLQSQNSNMNTSLDRNFKNINANLTQLKQSIKECETLLTSNLTTRNQQFKIQQTSILKTVTSKIDRNKNKQNELKTKLQNSNNGQDGIKKHVKDIENDYMSQIREIKEEEPSSNKNQEQDQCLKQTGSEIQQLILGIIQQETFLKELTDFHKIHSNQLSQKLSKIQQRLNIFIGFLEKNKQLKPFQREHLKKELSYLEDLWIGIEAEVGGVKKKYLIEMRKLEDKLVQLESVKKAVNWKGLEIANLSNRLQVLNNSISEHMKQVNHAQALIGGLKGSLSNVMH